MKPRQLLLGDRAAPQWVRVMNRPALDRERENRRAVTLGLVLGRSKEGGFLANCDRGLVGDFGLGLLDDLEAQVGGGERAAAGAVDVTEHDHDGVSLLSVLFLHLVR